MCGVLRELCGKEPKRIDKYGGEEVRNWLKLEEDVNQDSHNRLRSESGRILWWTEDPADFP